MFCIKRNAQITIWLFLLVLLLSSCGQTAAPTRLSPLQSTSNHTPHIPTAPPVPGSTPTARPTPTGTFTPATSVAPATARPDERVFIDPQGWYSVHIPAEWQAGDSPNSFVGKDGFFQTGYLPEMMFMRQVIDVCQWLANIDTHGAYSVSWLSSHGNGCQLVSLPGANPASVLEVIINPSADYPHRFIYIKADAQHFGQIANTLVWLQPVDKSAEPAFHTAPLRPEDISFWENTTPLPNGISVTEYKLPAEEQNKSPGKNIFPIPAGVHPEPRQSGATYSPNSQAKVNEIIEPFGYELRSGTEAYLYNLYKDGALALNNIYRLPDARLFSTPDGEKLAFLTHTVKDPRQPFYASDNAASYLVQNQTITLWEDGPINPMDPGRPPIWAAGEPLFLGLGDHTDVQVRNSQHDLLFSFETYFGTQIPVWGFQAWNEHWILEVSDFVIQDGEIINQKYGFEEAFNWYLMDGKPFYFFRKGPRVGISYDGQFLPIYFHEVIHGYCCGLALNNPRMYENAVGFFGKRDGIWYYVVVEIHNN